MKLLLLSISVIFFQISAFPSDLYTIRSFSGKFQSPINFLEMYDSLVKEFKPQNLEALFCDNKVEGDEKVFTNYLLPLNESRDSLIIVKGKKHYVYKDQALYRIREGGLESLKRIPGSVKPIFKALKKLEQDFSYGNRLVKFLEKSPHNIFINISSKSSNFLNQRVFGEDNLNNYLAVENLVKEKVLYKEKISFEKLGGRVFLSFNPYVFKESERAIALGHELYHAYDATRGFFIDGVIDSYVIETGTAAVEYRAVYFENLLRRELGLSLRENYGKDPKNTMFYQGEMVWIPEPCFEKSPF